MEDIKIFTDLIEGKAREQIKKVAALPAFSGSKIRIMPDVHAGSGCVIGFTADLGAKVIPSIVGVDIGCGMRATYLDVEELDFKEIDNIIECVIPSGANVRDVAVAFDLTRLRCYDALKDVDRLQKSLGTLGGGNHFIEIDVDATGHYHLIVHTGSRGLGKQVAEYYMEKAIEHVAGKKQLKLDIAAVIEQLKAEGRQKEIQSTIEKMYADFAERVAGVDKTLAYIEGQDRLDYLHDMEICQEYASKNREVISHLICYHLGLSSDSSFETVHNYISFEDNIVRKGAIAAYEGEFVLIPLNMRDGCILGRGKGNKDWNCSAPHGAGRLMSRRTAREQIGMADFQHSMEGIYTSSVCEETLDEAPFAYKPMDSILDNIKDTVDVIEIFHPVYNYKAH